YTISVESLATLPQPASVKSNEVNVANANTALGVDFEFTIGNGKSEQSIVIEEEDTINTVIQKINAKTKESGVTAFYSEGDKKIVFTSIETGPNAMVNVSGVEAGGSNPLGLINQSNSGQEGEAASVKINGVTVRPISNSFTYDGMRIS